MTEGAYAHFIGIGGAGMSGIALVLHERGLRVTGSDLKRSGYTRLLEDAGISVSIGHDAAGLGDPEVVVVSTAIPETNPELAEAKRRGIPVWPRARMLAEVAGDRTTVAVAGTHGKTTTSSMTAAALVGAGADPTFLVGGELNDVGANAGCGDGDFYVVEADESDGSLLFLAPHVAVITNVEADHLDHYGTLQAIEDTFVEFTKKVPDDGVLVLCSDDPLLRSIGSSLGTRVVTYGENESADVRCRDARQVGLEMEFTVAYPDGNEVPVSIRVPGSHNAVNATGALATVWALGLDVEQAARALGSFTGVRRRFDVVGEVDGVTVVDDYAHHPTEIKATLTAARRCGFERVWAVFQPHRYTRTAALEDDFAEAFEAADRVVMMDVYSAGETPIPGISGKTLVEAVLTERPRTRLTYFPHRTDVEPYLTPRLRDGDLVMTLGAGDVTNVGDELVRALRSRGATA